MEAAKQATTQAPAPKNAPAPGPKTELTAKAIAAAEEQNAARLVAQKQAEEARAAAQAEEPVSIIGLAAQGREVLLDHLRQHAQRAKKPEYVPPPRTDRQMSQLEEELEAGRRAQAKAQAQLDARPVVKADPVKDGFTTPVYRPGNLVPDPTIAATSGPGGLSAAGTREYGSDAP